MFSVLQIIISSNSDVIALLIKKTHIFCTECKKV